MTIMKAGMGYVGVTLLAGLASGQESDQGASPPCIEDRAALMAMDYWTFDQSPEGVRSVAAKPGCEVAAADLISDFHKALRASGEPVTAVVEGNTITFSQNGEVSLLYWHEGQYRAFAGQTDEAIELFRKSLKPEAQNYHGWNEYVLASVAFLAGERDTLLSQHEALAARTPPGWELNLRVVDGLIACFDRSYAEAYGAEECNHRGSGMSDVD